MDDFERPEAPVLDDEDVLQPDDVTPTEEVLSQLDAETPAVMPQAPAPELLLAQKKSKKKVLLIVLAMVLAFAAVGRVVWFVLANKAPQGGTNEDMAGQPSERENNDDNEKPADEPEPKDEIVELSVDDELVQKLYGQFTNQKIWFGLLENEEIDNAVLLQVAHSNVKRTPCRGTHHSVPAYREENIEASCYDGKTMRNKVYEIFGKNVEINDGDGLSVWYCEGYLYDALHDEFWHSGGGCSGTFTFLQRALIGAEKNEGVLYLYEVAAYSKVVVAGREDDYMDFSYQGPIEARFYRLEEVSDQFGVWYQPGEKIDLVLTQEQLPSVNRFTTDHDAEKYLRQYANQLDKFKWTFVWNGENYVFEKLEKIQ